MNKWKYFKLWISRKITNLRRYRLTKIQLHEQTKGVSSSFYYDNSGTVWHKRGKWIKYWTVCTMMHMNIDGTRMISQHDWIIEMYEADREWHEEHRREQK